MVVGASGGVDSTVLLRLLHEAEVPVVAAHVDYGLRSESGEDAAFVHALADELGIPAVIQRVTLPEAGNRQEAAREARYEVFREVAEAHGVGVVAVGHTATDQAETVLLNLIRGAGQAGLAGMREDRPLAPGLRLVRPMLGVTRDEVEALAREREWTWREDASNASTAYRRNRLRHNVLPLLEEEGGPGTIPRIADAARRLRETAEVTEVALSRVAEERPDGLAVPLPALRVLPEAGRLALLASAMRRAVPEAPRSQSVIANIESLVDSRVGARVELGRAIAWRDRTHLVLARPEAGWGGIEVGIGGRTETLYGTLTLTGSTRRSAGFAPDPNHEVADLAALAGPLVLRPWWKGDRFHPLGMEGSVLVSDLLTNRKVPPSTRARQLVLTSGDAIVWVVGHRLAEAARITDATLAVVSMEWTPRG